MAWDFVVETGAALATATSYITTAFGDDYNGRHPYGTAWTGTSTVKENLAMLASRAIDHHCLWYGSKVSASQGLEFPRYDVNDRDGNAFASDAIPLFLKVAVAEFARKLISEDLTADPTRGLQSLSVEGAVALVFDPSDRRLVLPDSVRAMVADYCRIRRSGGAIRLKRA
jgi:hypothetical protein